VPWRGRCEQLGSLLPVESKALDLAIRCCSVDQSTLHAIVVRMSGQAQASCLCLQRFGMEQMIIPVNCQSDACGGGSRSPNHASGVGRKQHSIQQCLCCSD
jgi:hypothetical protein